MSRQPRVYSNTGIYHVMIRGINKEKIFSKGVYKFKVLEMIKEINNEVELCLIAYCVMDNHLHLLLKADENELTTFMKRLNITYAMYYNHFEERCGHVFQDRYKSEAVEDEKYFFGVLRYIHNNPIKAGISDKIYNYKWSSANDYIKHESKIISDKHLLNVMNSFGNIDEFIKFNNIDDNIVYIDIKEEEAERTQYIINNAIEQFINKYQFIDQKQLKQEHKEELANILIELGVCSLRKIAGLCNMSNSAICELNKELKK